jgi:hypothetical protein
MKKNRDISKQFIEIESFAEFTLILLFKIRYVFKMLYVGRFLSFCFNLNIFLLESHNHFNNFLLFFQLI